MTRLRAKDRSRVMPAILLATFSLICACLATMVGFAGPVGDLATYAVVAAISIAYLRKTTMLAWWFILPAAATVTVACSFIFEDVPDAVHTVAIAGCVVLPLAMLLDLGRRARARSSA